MLYLHDFITKSSLFFNVHMVQQIVDKQIVLFILYPKISNHLQHLKCFLRIKYYENSPVVTIYACIHQSIPSQYGILKYVTLVVQMFNFYKENISLKNIIFTSNQSKKKYLLLSACTALLGLGVPSSPLHKYMNIESLHSQVTLTE